MKIFFMSLTFLCICSHEINGQEINKKHAVKKGETVYRISKIYNVSVADIFALNPNSREVIYVNDVLLIPGSSDNSSSDVNQKVLKATNNSKDVMYLVKKGDTKYGISKKHGITIAQLEQNNSQIINGLHPNQLLKINASLTNVVVKNIIPEKYLVKKGDTKYGLSKKFGVTIAQLEQTNPQIISGLQAKHVLNIKSSELPEIIQNINPKKYQVKKGDTKYGLSKNFNTTIAALEALNPEIVNMLRSDITITIPSSSNNHIQPNTINLTEEESNSDSLNINAKNTEAKKEEIKTTESAVKVSVINNPSDKYTNLRLTVNTSRARKILFVLPFTDNEFMAYANDVQYTEDAFLKQNIDYFKGAKRAIDSAKSLGLNFEVDVLKINYNHSAETDLSFMPNLNILESYDGILSPFYQNETELISESVLNKNIPVITLHLQRISNKSSNIFEALPSAKIQKLKLISYLKAKNGNIVLISDSNREKNRSIVLEQSPNAHVVDVHKQGENLNSELILALDKQKTNYVIIDSQRNSVFLNSTNLLLKELSDYAIQLAVLESSIIPDSKSLSSKRFKVLNLIYPALNGKNAKDFQITDIPDYKNLGYNITFDTLLRLSQSNSFETSANQSKTEYASLNFDYKKGNSGSYINTDVLILEYNKMKPIKKQND